MLEHEEKAKEDEKDEKLETLKSIDNNLGCIAVILAAIFLLQTCNL